MLIVPVTAQASQTFTVELAGQNCRLNIYQKSTGLFIDVYLGDQLVIAGVLCVNGVRIVQSAYLGFAGDLAFYDMQGTEDPYFTGLGTRWFLAYLP